MRTTRWRLSLVLGGLLLALYVGSYVELSRSGYAEADRFNMKGFYYVMPENSDWWRLQNFVCVALFFPINAIDQVLGLGRHPASEPLWELNH